MSHAPTSQNLAAKSTQELEALAAEMDQQISTTAGYWSQFAPSELHRSLAMVTQWQSEHPKKLYSNKTEGDK